MTQTLISIFVIFLQFLAGQYLGFGVALAWGVGGGWELLVIPLGNTVGVFGVGAVALWLRGERWRRLYMIRLGGTAVGSALGALLIRITPGTGYNQVLYPLVGALLGFYLILPLLHRLYDRQ
ncbi:MAG: hypothetical protein H6658_07615 [Ardenticatenaceae bacterium]|nr:hypothetical protein [Ardenticatenaceae bacterium]